MTQLSQKQFYTFMLYGRNILLDRYFAAEALWRRKVSFINDPSTLKFFKKYLWSLSFFLLIY